MTIYEAGTTNVVYTENKNYTGTDPEQLNMVHGGASNSGPPFGWTNGVNAGKEFDIEVVAVYDCDNETKFSDPTVIYDQVIVEKVCNYTFEIDTNYNPQTVTVECPQGSFVQDFETSIRIQFYNTQSPSSPLAAAYGLSGPGLNTEFNLKVQHEICAGAPPSIPIIFEEIFTLTFDGSLGSQPLIPIPSGQGSISYDMTAGWVEYRYRSIKREECDTVGVCSTLNSGQQLIGQPGLYGVCLDPVTLPTPGGTSTICIGDSFDTEINDC